MNFAPKLAEKSLNPTFVIPDGSTPITILFGDGKKNIISRYEDMQWYLELDVSNLPSSSQLLDFGNFPIEFQEFMKCVTYVHLKTPIKSRMTLPAGNTNISFFSIATKIIKYFYDQGVRDFCQVTEYVCGQYREYLSSDLHNTKTGYLAESTKHTYLGILKRLVILSKGTPFQPYDDAFIKISKHRKGFVNADKIKIRSEEPKTPLIPDEQLLPLYSICKGILKSSKQVIALSNELIQLFKSEPNSHKREKIRPVIIGKYFPGISRADFEKKVIEVRTACYVLIALLTGCRNHEIAFIKTNSWRRVTMDDGHEFYIISSKSTKSKNGYTDWLAPSLAIEAIKALQELSAPMREEISYRIHNDIYSSEIELARLKQDEGSILLTIQISRSFPPRTVDVNSVNRDINTLARQAGIDWNFSTHQFRRKYANFAARSKLGILRSLRDQFKHSSLSDTILYCHSDNYDEMLFSEIAEELFSCKTEIVSNWSRPTSKLTGPGGRSFSKWRESEAPVLFKNLNEMARVIAKSVSIVYTGHGWCTGSESKCIGSSTLDSTKCYNCNNSIIDEAMIEFYKDLRKSAMDAINCADIGEAGKVRLMRDLNIFNTYLTDLGICLDL